MAELELERQARAGMQMEREKFDLEILQMKQAEFAQNSAAERAGKHTSGCASSRCR